MKVEKEDNIMEEESKYAVINDDHCILSLSMLNGSTQCITPFY